MNINYFRLIFDLIFFKWDIFIFLTWICHDNIKYKSIQKFFESPRKNIWFQGENSYYFYLRYSLRDRTKEMIMDKKKWVDGLLTTNDLFFRTQKKLHWLKKKQYFF